MSKRENRSLIDKVRRRIQLEYDGWDQLSTEEQNKIMSQEFIKIGYEVRNDTEAYDDFSSRKRYVIGDPYKNISHIKRDITPEEINILKKVKLLDEKSDISDDDFKKSTDGQDIFHRNPEIMRKYL